MGLFEDFSHFLETRLEEFLRNHPHLELQALEEQLREQEQDALRLIGDLQHQERQLQEKILATAQEIQRWHQRIDKAQTAGRLDLAQAAQEREAALLREGNQLWGQMQGAQTRLQQTQTLHRQIQGRRQEVQVKIKAAATQPRTGKPFDPSNPSTTQSTAGWQQGPTRSHSSGTTDPLEQVFQRWETDAELEQLKRNMKK